jgi:long-subunit acyl-CoA synthetase (AMP-forming)
MGYLGMEEKTREVFDEEGKLHSGDIGRLDEDGFLFITGRIKGIYD